MTKWRTYKQGTVTVRLTKAIGIKEEEGAKRTVLTRVLTRMTEAGLTKVLEVAMALSMIARARARAGRKLKEFTLPGTRKREQTVSGVSAMATLTNLIAALSEE